MNKYLLLAFLLPAFVSSFSAQSPVTVKPPGPLSDRILTASELNGTYTYRRNTFKVLAIDHNKIKVQFHGEWMTRGGYPNTGDALGEAKFEGNVAVFIPKGTTDCKITMSFLTNRVEVQQEGEGDCGFGHNVVATGTYRRIKGGAPRFVPVR